VTRHVSHSLLQNNLHYLTRPDSLETCVLPQASSLSVSQAAGHYRLPSSSSADSSISLGTIYWARSSGVSTTTGLQEHKHVAVMLQQTTQGICDGKNGVWHAFANCTKPSLACTVSQDKPYACSLSLCVSSLFACARLL